MKSLPALLLLVTATSAFSQGVLLVKDRAVQADTLATGIEFRTIDRFGAVTNIVTQAGVRQQIQNNRIVIDVPYESLASPARVVSQEDAELAGARLAKVRTIVAAYPTLQRYVARFATDNQLVLDQYKKGIYLVNQQWITAVDYHRNLEMVQKAKAEAERKRSADAAEAQRKRMADAAEAERKRSAEAAERRAAEQERLRERATELETTLVRLRASAATLGKAVGRAPNTEAREFLLKRKLPKAKFESLYKIAPYVIECITRGGESCILVSPTMSTIGERYVSLEVTNFQDIDVTTYNGHDERVTVFVHHVPSQDEADLRNVIQQINAKSSDLNKVRSALGEPSRKSESLQVSADAGGNP